jgi:hypothetical protein
MVTKQAGLTKQAHTKTSSSTLSQSKLSMPLAESILLAAAQSAVGKGIAVKGTSMAVSKAIAVKATCAPLGIDPMTVATAVSCIYGIYGYQVI